MVFSCQEVQTTKWLQACEESLDEEEISWWPLLLLLTDGSDTATRELAKWLLAVWRWVKKVSNTPTCPPASTVHNIEQFLNDCPKEGDHTPWLLAYAHVLQCMGEATDGRMWQPSGVHFTPQISLLVAVFIQETGVELVQADIASQQNLHYAPVLPSLPAVVPSLHYFHLLLFVHHSHWPFPVHFLKQSPCPLSPYLFPSLLQVLPHQNLPQNLYPIL